MEPELFPPRGKGAKLRIFSDFSEVGEILFENWIGGNLLKKFNDGQSETGEKLAGEDIVIFFAQLHRSTVFLLL